VRLSVLLFIITPLWGGCLLPPLPPASTDPVLLIEQGRHKLALAELTAADAHTAYLKSKAEAGLGDLEASLHSAEHALELEPNRAEYHVQVAAACGRLAEKASLFRQLGLARRAKKELETALQLNPADIDALYGNMLFFYAAPSFVGGDKAKAEATADAIVKLNPGRGYLAHAQMAKDRKDLAGEESDYRKSVAADPKFHEAHTALAAFLLPTDRAAAEAEGCEAVHLDPYRATAWVTLVEAAVLEQCWDEMFARLAAARAAVPESPEPEYAAGVALVRLGMHYNWAVQFLEHYQGPNEAMAKQKLAEARGRLEAALASN
jgi:tetratricopeptide (TPR) repeat protein